MKKYTAHKRLPLSKNTYGGYFFVAFLALVLAFSLVTSARSNTNGKIVKSQVFRRGELE